MPFFMQTVQAQELWRVYYQAEIFLVLEEPTSQWEVIRMLQNKVNSSKTEQGHLLADLLSYLLVRLKQLSETGRIAVYKLLVM